MTGVCNADRCVKEVQAGQLAVEGWRTSSEALHFLLLTKAMHCGDQCL